MRHRRQYITSDAETDMPRKKKVEHEQVDMAVVSVELADFDLKAEVLESSTDSQVVAMAADKAQIAIRRALREVKLLETDLPMQTRGPSAIFAVTRPTAAVQFADALAVHERADWLFRVGVAFGTITIQKPATQLQGMTVEFAIALMRACPPGEIVIAQQAWAALSDEGKRTFQFGVLHSHSGKPFQAYRRRRPPQPESATVSSLEQQGNVALEFFEPLQGESIIEWSQWFSVGDCVDVCVQGWDGWIERNREAFKELFQRGGHVNLLVPDVRKTDQLSMIASRLGRQTPAQVKEVVDTYERLKSIWAEVYASHTCGSLTVYRLSTMTWYCAVRFGCAPSPENNVLVLSLYENIHERDDPIPPFYWIPLHKHPRTSAWIAKELNGLMTLGSAEKKTFPE